MEDTAPVAPPQPITSTTSTTEVYVAQPKGVAEPVVVATCVSAVVVQAVGLAAAFGLDVSDSQRTAILSCVEPTVVMLFALGPLIRNWVTPAWKAKALIDAAHQAGLVGADKPQL